MDVPDDGYTGKRGYHPLLAVAAGTGDVLYASWILGKTYPSVSAVADVSEFPKLLERVGIGP